MQQAAAFDLLGLKLEKIYAAARRWLKPFARS